MERKDFLRKAGFGFLIGQAALACQSTQEVQPVGSTGGSTTPGSTTTTAPGSVTTTAPGSTTTSGSSCAVTNSETAGPFPTKSPASYVRNDIRDGQTGVAFTMNITIKTPTPVARLWPGRW